ncbi:hypothetical protein UJ101_00122 [Flavobacteriaceae bacterium UJ101]|nr:hypothetical protein UJ101_00122 [Flavobacteriaceae bacterium UJ101]
MRKRVFVVITTVVMCTYLIAQVGIGVNGSSMSPSAVLEIVSQTKNQGVLFPKLTTAEILAITNPAQGLLVYNKESHCIYMHNGTTWLSSCGIAPNSSAVDQISYNALGYVSNGSASSAAENLTIPNTSITAEKKACYNNTINNHDYCAYQLSTGVTWQDAFNLGKELKGYLVTITSDAEWSFIKSSVIGGSATFDLDNNIWIGYNRVSYPGNDAEFMWITDEKSLINWSNNSSTQNNFNAGEPNDSGGNEGCSHIWHNGSSTSDRTWNDEDCTSTEVGFGLFSTDRPFDQVIIEFESNNQ